MPFLPPNQQRQSTEGTINSCSRQYNLNVSSFFLANNETVNAVVRLASAFSSIRAICPKKVKRRDLMMDESGNESGSWLV